MKFRNVLTICFLFAFVISSTHTVLAGSKADPDELEFLAVFMEGKKIGFAIHSRTVSEEKVTTSEEVCITLNRIGVPITVQMRETSFETTKGKPLGFKLEQKLGAMNTTLEGKVDDQGMVELTTKSIGPEQKKTFRWPGGAVMAEGLRLIQMKKPMKEGTEYNVKIFSSGILQALDAQIRIGAKQNVDLLGRVVALREMTTILNMPGSGNVVTTSYVDDDLDVQKTTMPVAGMNVEMVACTKEFALGQNDVLDVIDKMFLDSPEPLKNLDETESITYYFTPKPGASNLIIPSDDNQHVQYLNNGNIIVTIKPVSARSGATFPYKGSDPAILEAMESTRFLQSDDKDVIALARRAIGDTKDAAEAAKRIEAFVGRYVQNRSLSVGYASAAEVAASRQGDCSEFAVLTAAMCRAVGIPSRVAVGVAYVDEFAGHQGFGGHAWAQAYVGGKWIGLDASFKGGGRGGYDAGHIALAIGNGNPEDFFNLTTSMGQFEIERITVNDQ